MVKVGDIMTTVEKEEYPFTVEILEIYPCKTKAKCLREDTDGCRYVDYELIKLRHLSAKEIYENVFRYFGMNECQYPFYSKSHLEWLKSEAKTYEDYRDMIEKDCEKRAMDIADLPSKELWEYDRANEISGWMNYLAEIIEGEIKEVMEGNPA